MEIVKEEEIRIVHDSSKGVQGEHSHRNWGSEVGKNVLLSRKSFQVALQLEVRHWIEEEKKKVTNIFKSYYHRIKCIPTNSVAALMWR